MKWIIIKDLIDGGDSLGTSVGIEPKPSKTFRNLDADSLKAEVDRLVAAGVRHKFRLYDDDGELYYEGLSSDAETEAAFDPLDWAMGHSGCTRIDYLINGKWEIL